MEKQTPFSNEGLEMYLDAPEACRTDITNPAEAKMYYNGMVSLGVPPDIASHIMHDHLPMEITEKIQ